MIRLRLDPAWRVRAGYTAAIPVSRQMAWRVLRDFERIVCLDHFHRTVRLQAPEPAQGVDFDLPHRFLGLRIARQGRIVRWNEGRGYAFSDLSAKDPVRGFPHVFAIEISSAAEAADECRLELSVSGRWTARFLPRPVVYLWLAWNLLSMGLAIENAVLADAVGTGSPDR